jgi:hypothetical protein
MRGLFNQVGRGITAAAVVVMLAVPAQARATDEQGWWGASTLVKAVKRLVVKTFGDGLIIPRP